MLCLVLWSKLLTQTICALTLPAAPPRGRPGSDEIPGRRRATLLETLTRRDGCPSCLLSLSNEGSTATQIGLRAYSPSAFLESCLPIFESRRIALKDTRSPRLVFPTTFGELGLPSPEKYSRERELKIETFLLSLRETYHFSCWSSVLVDNSVVHNCINCLDKNKDFLEDRNLSA